MPDSLRDATAVESTLSAGTMSLRLAIAAGFGLVIALVYRLSHGRLARDTSTLIGTLVLLTILLAMITMVIGDSVARAFGLVGALSIVRFRTVVEDTRDTAFVIFAVVVGMAVGTGLVLVAIIGVPIVGAAALVLANRSTAPASASARESRDAGVLTVRLGAGNPTDAVEALLVSKAASWRMTGLSTARQGASLDVSYEVRLVPGASPAALMVELNGLPGVQSVDLRKGIEED